MIAEYLTRLRAVAYATAHFQQYEQISVMAHIQENTVDVMADQGPPVAKRVKANVEVGLLAARSQRHCIECPSDSEVAHNDMT